MIDFEHVYWSPVIVITLCAAGFLFLLGGLFLAIWYRRKKEVSPSKDIAVSLITGALFLIASGLNQMTVEMSSFRDSVALSQDLTGFDPGGRSLQEYTLAGKKLKRASLSGVNLRKADLSESDLASAELIGADLHNAQLFYAELLQAELENADFSEANLEGAKMSTPDVLDVNLDGADVHGETCWFIASDLFEEADEVESEDLEGQPAKILNKVVTAGLDPKNGETLGHVCTEDEAEAEEFPENDNWYICREEPHIRLSSEYVGADVCF